MEDSTGYTRRVTHRFTVNDEEWEVTFANSSVINFTETRKNGQEDCHMSGEAEFIDGKWVLEKYTRERIQMYGRIGSADAVEEFFNTYGPPTER